MLVETLLNIIEPLMIVFVGTMIGVMVVASYLPTFCIGDTIHWPSMVASNRQTTL